MKVSTKTRYGIRLMIDLGINYGKGSIFLKDIAKREEISEKYLSQIIIPLRTAKLVNSFRGAHGGYVLSRPPEEISMRDIFEALEGNFDLLNCIHKPEKCERSTICVTREIWNDLGATIAQKLESMLLSDFVKKYIDKKELTIAYAI